MLNMARACFVCLSHRCIQREREREKEREGLHSHTYIHPGSCCRAGLSHTLYFFYLSNAHTHLQDVFFSFPCPQVSISLPTVETACHFAVEGGPFYGQVLLWMSRHTCRCTLKIIYIYKSCNTNRFGVKSGPLSGQVLLLTIWYTCRYTMHLRQIM